MRKGKKLKIPLVRMVHYGFSGIELSGTNTVKVFRCEGYHPRSPVSPGCVHDEVDKEGYEKCERKREILKELKISEPWSECKCGLYRPYYWYIGKLFAQGRGWGD